MWKTKRLSQQRWSVSPVWEGQRELAENGEGRTEARAVRVGEDCINHPTLVDSWRWRERGRTGEEDCEDSSSCQSPNAEEGASGRGLGRVVCGVRRWISFVAAQIPTSVYEPPYPYTFRTKEVYQWSPHLPCHFSSRPTLSLFSPKPETRNS